MTEIGPKTQTPTLIGDADVSASKDPFAFLSLGDFENFLDAEMIAAVMGGVSLESSETMRDGETLAGDSEGSPLAAAQALLALAETQLRAEANAAGTDPKKAAQILKKADILALRAVAIAAGDRTGTKTGGGAAMPGQTMSQAVKSPKPNLTGAALSSNGEAGTRGQLVTEWFDKTTPRPASGKLQLPENGGVGETDAPLQNAKPGAGKHNGTTDYGLYLRGVKAPDAAAVQVNALGIAAGGGAGAEADTYTTNGLLAAQMRAKSGAQTVETARNSASTSALSDGGAMSSENGFAGGRENGAGGAPGTQTQVAGARSTVMHLDMLTKDWNEKLAQALEQRISGGGKEIDFMLTPKSLGRLRVSMSMLDGQLNLAIKTDTAMAAAMLSDAESQLMQMLEARDLRVASFAASTSGQPGQQNDKAPQGDKSPNRGALGENEDDIESFDEISAATADDDGINVTA
jgi:flagellar hook-length control protein FliK